MGEFWRGRQWPTSTLCPAMRELTSRNANVLRYSESAANLLVDNGSNFAIFSECALISKEKLSDFDSAIPLRRLESVLRCQTTSHAPGLHDLLHPCDHKMSGAVGIVTFG